MRLLRAVASPKGAGQPGRGRLRGKRESGGKKSFGMALILLY
jgi:hypothetical protein